MVPCHRGLPRLGVYGLHMRRLVDGPHPLGRLETLRHGLSGFGPVAVHELEHDIQNYWYVARAA